MPLNFSFICDSTKTDEMLPTPEIARTAKSPENPFKVEFQNFNTEDVIKSLHTQPTSLFEKPPTVSVTTISSTYTSATNPIQSNSVFRPIVTG